MTRDPSPLVTVYIANHNYGCFIEQAIESVLKQTLEDFELIVIDDGSTDNSREIIERYADHPKVITIFQHNQGLNVTNNIALRAAHGTYIMRLDADDYLDENALQVMSGVLERNPDIGLVFPDYYHVDEAGNVFEIVRRHNFDDVTLLDQPAHGACTMIRRSCLLALDGYDESFHCQDGWDLWVRFIQHYTVRNVNLPLFYYRQHAASLTRDEKRLLDTRADILAKQAQRNGRYLRAVAVVPVRGRATDPHSIALKLLGGRPLIDWTLEVALASERLDGVIISTPDDDILAHVRAQWGDRVLPVKRDKRLAVPNTFIEDTVFHALDAYPGDAPDAVVMLYIDCPFREARHIDSALDVMELFDTDTVFAVRPETDVFYQHDGTGLVPLNRVNDLRLEREEIFRQVAKMHVVRRRFLETHKQVVGGRVGHIVVGERAALTLGSEYEWQIAEMLADHGSTADATGRRVM